MRSRVATKRDEVLTASPRDRLRGKPCLLPGRLRVRRPAALPGMDRHRSGHAAEAGKNSPIADNESLVRLPAWSGVVVLPRRRWHSGRCGAFGEGVPVVVDASARAGGVPWCPAKLWVWPGSHSAAAKGGSHASDWIGR